MLRRIEKYQDRILRSFRIENRRYLFDEIDFDDRMIAIFGARGVGKTTMLLQYLLDLQKAGKKVLYISLDYPFLSGVDLLELVEEFAQNGGAYLLLDEVHRYPYFGTYLKSIYDLFDLHVLFTGSSAVSILDAKSDLSRRVTLYHLAGFSFREYLNLVLGERFAKVTLQEIIEAHETLAKRFEKCNILRHFHTYLQYGYYPFYFDKKSAYLQNLVNTINLTIDIDLTSLGLVEQKYTYKLKRLLEVICESEPFEVNYTKIAAAAEISRVKLYDYITYLRDGEMLLLVTEAGKGIRKISKPAKIYLNNTNLLYAYCEKAKKGTIRETFFANQLQEKHILHISKSGDFIVDEKETFEIGGKSKDFSQISGIEESFVVSDDIEKGSGRKIPLWMFGFLY
ncbi:MAG TPA: AAA family ATPase [Campylobacteraceae bacterium]|nr:AAA family ATPase [Campylobacteraceae bacterium]